MYVHTFVKVRGQHQMYSSVDPHLIFEIGCVTEIG